MSGWRTVKVLGIFSDCLFIFFNVDIKLTFAVLIDRFGKSSAMYASWMIMFIVIGEYATGKITDGLWTINNYGKTFTTVDWSKFDEMEDDEDEDDDDDDDEDDDDDDE